jgi:protein gp37
MSDLFGEWVEQEWIDSILEVCEKTPKWTYVFLTKNPKRVATVQFPPNCWVGTSIDTQARVEPALKAMENVKASVRFISCEPLKEDLTFPALEHIDWVIIGGQSRSSGEPAFQPEWEWVRHVEEQARKYHCRLYFKPNLDLEAIRPVEYPTVGLIRDKVDERR